MRYSKTIYVEGTQDSVENDRRLNAIDNVLHALRGVIPMVDCDIGWETEEEEEDEPELQFENTKIAEALNRHNVKEIVCLMGHNRVPGIGITVYRFRGPVEETLIEGQPMLWIDGNWKETTIVPPANFSIMRPITLLDTCYH
jgi:hypothetical protein